MALDFPANPSLNQVYTLGTKSWVWNGSGWEVQRPYGIYGVFNINTLSSATGAGGGSAAFNGTAYRFTLSYPPASAQQLIVSLNGVIQKPNAGTSQPAEGFAIDGADILFSDPPTTDTPFFIVTIGTTVNIGEPSDNSVTSAKLSDNSVTSAKIVDGTIVDADINASAAIAGSKISPDFGSQNLTTTGTSTAASFIPTSSTVPTNGVYLPGANSLGLSTNGALRATVDSSGRLLVGTSNQSKDSTLVLQGSALSGNNNESGIWMQRGTSSPANGDALGRIVFSDDTGEGSANIRVFRDGGTWSGSSKPGRLVFSTTADGASSPTERMRISANGDISLSSDNFGIRSHTSFYQSGGDIVQLRANRINNSGGYFYYNTSNVYGTISDARLKHNIELSSQVEDVEFIKGIEPHTFNFADGTHQLGFIAQNVLASAQNDAQKVAVANWETYEENSPDCPFLGVSVSPIVAALVNTCKAALERIETLEAKVAALESA